MIQPERTQELIKKLNSGCYLSSFDRDNIVKDMLELQETVYNQQQEINELKRTYSKVSPKDCNHLYSRSIAQVYPRLCMRCGQSEFNNWKDKNAST